MAVEPGTYVIVSAVATGNCLDIAGGSSSNGANVQSYKRNGSDAQMFTVAYVSGSTSWQSIVATLNGKALDVKAAGTKNGTNVQQYAWNSSNAQQWNIAADGKTVTIGGKSYPTYTIAPRNAQTRRLDIAGGSTKSGANVQIYQSNGSNAQRWAFVKVGTIPQGVYRIESAISSGACISAASASSKSGSNVTLAAVNATNNAQLWWINGGETAGQIRNVATGFNLKALKAANSGNVVLGATGSPKTGLERWLPTQSSNVTRNGTTSVSYTISLYDGNNLDLDAAGGGSTAGTNVLVYSQNGGANQKWVLTRMPVYQSLTAPSDAKAAYSNGGTGYSSLWCTGTQNVIPTWVCNESQYQVRYRTRSRKVTAGDTEYTGWSSWKSIADNSTANDGWGNMSASNSTPTLLADPNGSRRLYAKAIPVTLSMSTYDRVELQYEARPFRAKGTGTYASYPVCGPSASKTVWVGWRPTATVSAITWNPEGLSIRFTSDQKRNGNVMTVYSVTSEKADGTVRNVFSRSDGYAINNLKWSDSALLPQSQLSGVPEDGEQVTVTYGYANVDGAQLSGKQTATKTMSYDSDNGLAVNPTVQITESKMLYVKANVTGTSYAAYIDYDDDKISIAKYSDDDGTWFIPLKYGKPFRVFVIVRNGSNWGTWSRLYDAVSAPDAYVFDFEKSNKSRDYFSLRLNVDAPPKWTRTWEADFDAQLTNGDTFEVVHFGNASKRSFSVEGIVDLIDYDDSHGTLAKAEELFKAHYAWFRDPGSTSVYRVAITHMAIDESVRNYKALTVEMIRTE